MPSLHHYQALFLLLIVVSIGKKSQIKCFYRLATKKQLTLKLIYTGTLITVFVYQYQIWLAKRLWSVNSCLWRQASSQPSTLMYTQYKYFWGVWVILPPASGPHIRPSTPGPHALCTCFKETALLFTGHLSCFVNFTLCLTDKYMLKVNKLNWQIHVKS